MIDYYSVLEVSNDATEQQVRVAFRRLVKKYHPDVNARRQVWAHAETRKVLDAYAMLSDAARRAVYDKRLRYHQDSRRDMYRERLASRSDPESVSKLVLYDLLRSNPEQALDAYEAALAKDIRFEVSHHLGARDWMDCKFLLAEEYEKRKAYVRALGLYEDIYYSHRAREHYRHFLEEVAARIRNLCCRDLARTAGAQEAIGYYERVLGMKVNRTEKAFVHKKIAECYVRLGDRDKALSQMQRAFTLKADLKGCQKICEKLGIRR